MTDATRASRKKHGHTNAAADSPLTGLRQQVRSDPRYSAEAYALRAYLTAFERLLPVEVKVKGRRR
jgi:hypothetical protein